MQRFIRLFGISLVICGLALLAFAGLTGCGTNERYKVDLQRSITQAEQARAAEGIAQAESEAEQSRSAAGIAQAQSEAERARAQAEAQIANSDSIADMARTAASVQINAQDNQHGLAVIYADSQVMEVKMNGESLRYIAEHTYRTQDRLLQGAWIVLLVGVVCFAITKGISTTIPDIACKTCKYRRTHHVVTDVASGKKFENEEEWGWK